MANYYRLSGLFQSAANSDFPYLPSNLPFTIKKGKNVSTLLHASNVKETEKYVFDLFLTAIDVNPDDVDNYGFASYRDDVFSGNSPCFFGTREGQLGLLIGSANDELATRDMFIPCEVEQTEVTKGKKKVTEWQYTINGTLITLKEKIDNDGKGEGKFYVNLEYSDEYEEYVFTFPFLLDKKANYAPEDIVRAWKTGKFADVCRDVDVRGGGRMWLEVNKAFVPAFQQKYFPKDGVLLLATAGKIKITPAGTYVNVEKDIVQADWEIIATSHPELIIQYKNADKQMELATLQDGTNMQFTSAMVKNEGYGWLVEHTEPGEEYGGIVVIHIVSPSSIKITNSPVNTLTALHQRIEAKVAKYPHLAELYAKMTGNGSSKAALPPSREPSFSELEDVSGMGRVPVAAANGKRSLEDF